MDRSCCQRRIALVAMRATFWLCIGLGILVPPVGAELPADFGDVPDYDAQDPSAAPVTAARLLANERFWPYRVGLVRPWRPAGREQPLPVGIAGVLVRLESPDTARIDFGRDGVYDVPVAETDLVELANRVRRGELDKIAPNYVLTVGPRVLDASGDPPEPIPFRAVSERHGFVSVFADPGSDGFPRLAEALSPLRERQDLLVVLFPQGERRTDLEIAGLLREARWPGGFVRGFLAGPYTSVLLPDGLTPPAVLVQTREGRVSFRSAWSDAGAPALLSAVEAAFPAASASRAP